MAPITLEQLKTGLVRCAERWPDRVGLCGHFKNDDCSDHCITGQVFHDFGACSIYGVTLADWDTQHLQIRAAVKNNAGLPWRQIVIELGLITPEAPVLDPELSVEAVSEPEEVLLVESH